MIPLGIGEGKTAVGLHAILERGCPAVVFSTKSIVEQTWGQEIAEWGMPLTYAAATGSLANRRRAIESGPDVLGVSFDHMRWYLEQKGEGHRELCIIDESSFLKAWPSQSQRVRAMIGATGRFTAGCYALSASIAPEGALGLWSQFACLTKERPLGLLGQFRQTYFDEERYPNFSKWTIKPDGLRGIARALAPYFFPKPKSQPGRFGIPEPRLVPIRLPWSDDRDRERYMRLLSESTLEEEQILIGSPGVLQSKLRQLSSGFLYEGQQVLRFPSYHDKAEALEALVERINDQPLVVMIQFDEEREQIASRFPHAVFGLPSDLKAWDRGEIKMLVLHPKSAGHGVNLQHGGHHVHFYSLPWSFEDWEQPIGRVHRRGQRRQVVVSWFERAGTIETRMKATVEAKGETQERIVEELTLAAS